MMIALILGCIGLDIGTERAELPPELLKPHIESYTANRLAFPFWTFRFEVDSCQVKDCAALERGDVKVLATARGYYASDGRNARYELVHPPEDHARLSSSLDPSHTSSIIASYRALLDGNQVLMDMIMVDLENKRVSHDVGVRNNVKLFYFWFLFPFDLGRSAAPGDNFTKDFERLSRGHFRLVEYDPRATLGGRAAVRFVLTVKSSKRTYWLDPERSSIPMKIETRDDDGRIVEETIFDDIQPVPKVGWLPRRMAVYHDPQFAHVVRITEMRLDRPPGPSEFRLTFDQPTAIMDTIRGFIYKPRKEWGLLTLPTPEPGIARKVNVVKFQPKPMTVSAGGIPVPAADPLELPGERKTWPSWIVYTLLAAVGIAIGAAALGWRRRRSLGMRSDT